MSHSYSRDVFSYPRWIGSSESIYMTKTSSAFAALNLSVGKKYQILNS